MIATGQRFPETADAVWVQAPWFYHNLFQTDQIDFYVEDFLRYSPVHSIGLFNL